MAGHARYGAQSAILTVLGYTAVDRTRVGRSGNKEVADSFVYRRR